MTIGRRKLPRAKIELAEYGLGAAPLGNLYRPTDDMGARATLDAAIGGGFRYIDTAPFYGFGLSERRIGDAVRECRGEVILSTKVGRLLDAAPAVQGYVERHGFYSSMPFEPRFDYSYDGVLRSWQASLERLGLARIDILYVHDIGARTHGAAHDATFRQLTEGGGFRALEELRAAGEISAFGLGVNEWEICIEAMEHADLDIVLLAGRYTLLEQGALDIFLPRCLEQGVAVVVGGPFNSGILATGTRGGAPFYDYGPASADIVAAVRGIEDICDRHSVPLAAAALHFPLAHPAVVSVVAGLDNVARVRKTLELIATEIPDAFWNDLREAGLVRSDAPLPRASI